VNATPPGANTEYSRGSEASEGPRAPRRGRSQRVPSPTDAGWSSALSAAVLGSGLLGAALLVIAEFTTLFTISSTVRLDVKTVTTGSHDAYALIPIAVVAAVLSYGAAFRGSRVALTALGVLGIVTLGIALIGDLPDAQATGVIGSNATQLSNAAASPGIGLYLETLGAVVLIIAAGCGLLLGGGARPKPREPNRRPRTAPTTALVGDNKSET
jgi:hypothetical protein